VPITMKLSDNVEPVWFLALYVPKSLQWPTIGFVVLLGIACFGFAARIYRSQARTMRTCIARSSSTPEPR